MGFFSGIKKLVTKPFTIPFENTKKLIKDPYKTITNDFYRVTDLFTGGAHRKKVAAKKTAAEEAAQRIVDQGQRINASRAGASQNNGSLFDLLSRPQ